MKWCEPYRGDRPLRNRGSARWALFMVLVGVLLGIVAAIVTWKQGYGVDGLGVGGVGVAVAALLVGKGA